MNNLLNIELNQIKNDWHVLSYAAKWLGDEESKIMYKDQRNAKDVSNDKEMLKDLEMALLMSAPPLSTV